jgi:hypothetical protein
MSVKQTFTGTRTRLDGKFYRDCTVNPKNDVKMKNANRHGLAFLNEAARQQ